MTDILTRANEMLTIKHMIYSVPEYCAVVRGLVDEIKRKDEALRPFANYACDSPHVDEPICHNCIARAALTPEATNDAD